MHLGRAAQGAGREGGFEHIHAGELGLEQALHIADDVHHMAVTLHRKRLGDLDAANLRDAANVVARQVDQHHMLGTLFRVGQQLLLGRLVGLGRGATRTGARQGTNGDFLACWRMLLAHQDFGG